MAARPALASALVILAVLLILAAPARLAAQCMMGNCGSGSMMGGHGGPMMMGHPGLMTTGHMGPMMTPRPPAAAGTPAAPAGSAAGGAPTAEARAQAAEIWDSRCAACHGGDGRGDGPGAEALRPRPVNFRRTNWQKAVTDDQIAKAIVEGGGAVGLSNQMPANPDLEDDSAVVKALVARVREFGHTK